jgi:hypothetical protein
MNTSEAKKKNEDYLSLHFYWFFIVYHGTRVTTRPDFRSDSPENAIKTPLPKTGLKCPAISQTNFFHKI